MTTGLLANTKNQPLDQHSFAVGYLAHLIIDRQTGSKGLATLGFYSGCLHDIGKIDPNFQAYLKSAKAGSTPSEFDGEHIHKKNGFGFDKYPRHHELSYLWFSLFADQKLINGSAYVEYALYWSHAKPCRNEELTKARDLLNLMKGGKRSAWGEESSFPEIVSHLNDFSRHLNAIAIRYGVALPEIPAFILTDDIDAFRRKLNIGFPEYKSYHASAPTLADYDHDVAFNAEHNILRSAINTADRIISSLSMEELASSLEDKSIESLYNRHLVYHSDLKHSILSCLEGFTLMPGADDNRNRSQSEAATSLSEIQEDAAIKVLQGPAGCGKTKIALEWAAMTSAQKLIWVCPRVQVCQGLMSDLSGAEYLRDRKIEIHTGEFRYIMQDGVKTDSDSFFSGDIVITTIDQLTASIVTHHKTDAFMAYMASHVVFDEFHEYVNMTAYNLFFAELIHCKKMQGSIAKTILVSATPNPVFVEELLGIHKNDTVCIESFNKSSFKMRIAYFDETLLDGNPFYERHPENTFVVSNTAKTAQKGCIANQDAENSLLFHSLFKKSDKLIQFGKVYGSFGKAASRQFDVLRSGPAIQASLNVSSKNMVSELTTIENTIQRKGRMNRFDEHGHNGVFTMAVPISVRNKTQSGDCLAWLARLNSKHSALKWHAFLCDYICSLSHSFECTMSISDLYGLYDSFYNEKGCRDAVRMDLFDSLKDSVKLINEKLVDPVVVKAADKDLSASLKSHSFRGDNLYVQMAVANVFGAGLSTIDFTESYAYEEGDLSGELTFSQIRLEGYRNSDKDLIEHMRKKHPSIKQTNAEKRKDILIRKARSAEHPIYTSYTPGELKTLGNGKNHDHAIYYIHGASQPIGMMTLN